MKKTLIISLITILSLCLSYGFADAAVTGRCDKCHTMHNSQNGSPMAADFSGSPSATPYGHLTRSSCLGCHNGVITDAGAPNVFGTQAGMTAGGTFLNTIVDAAASDYMKVHNVRDITWTNDEVPLMNYTPGAESGGYTEPVGAAELACAGYLGCHGRHDGTLTSDGGIKGFHHGAYTGYRYLQFYDGAGTHTPIDGEGSPDWEQGGADAANHNIYKALTGTTDTDRHSISSLCSLCHGDYHEEADIRTAGSWIRHPTENLLSDATTWTMASVTVNYENNPFGFEDLGTVSTGAAYTTTNARVVCVSCHRAHGDFTDILRWDYGEQLAGSTTQTLGCLGCHHLQRG